LPWQIAVSVFGLIVSTMIVTGLLIWWRKRKVRNVSIKSQIRGETG
jgi:uncharacterized iron-regulated membrane protein